MHLDAQRITNIKGATPAVLCLLTIAASLPIFAWHWVNFALLLRQPGLEQVARVPYLVGLNRLMLGSIAIFAVLLLWLWPRRRRPEALPRLSTLIALVSSLTYCAMGIVFGALTSPVTTVMVSALVIGLAMLGRRPTVIGFVVAIVLLTLADWLVLGGVMPYAPALVPASFQGGQPVAWWRQWQDTMFFAALCIGIGLMVWLFAHLDRQRRLLEELSRSDGLTQLSNRRHFMERLAVERYRRDRYGLPFSVVLCDADHFKQINDGHGHQMGDQVLCHLGELLNTGLRIPGDVAARLGGEEFALLLTDCREPEARAVCERLRKALRGHEFTADGQRFRVTMSMGAVECRSGSDEDALKAADVNLYQAKSGGRDAVVSSVYGEGA